MKKHIILVFAVFMIGGLVFLAGCNEATQDDETVGYPISMAATSASSGFYPLNVAIADVINDHVPGAVVTVLETGAMSDNVGMIERGEAMIAQGSDPDLYSALEGIGIFEGEAYTKGRQLILVEPIVYYHIVTVDSGINSLSELDGQHYNPGLSGSGAERISLDVFRTLDIQPNYYEGTLRDAIDATQDRRIVGFHKAGSVASEDSAIMETNVSIPVKALSLTDEEVSLITAEYPYFPFFTIENLYGGDEFITTVGLAVGQMLSSDISQEFGYAIAKAVYENIDYIAEAYPGAGKHDPFEVTLTAAQAPLHAGVVQYFLEEGYDVPDRLIPPEYN